MKFIGILLISLIIQNCSFDNKTGIWKNDQNIKDKVETGTYKNFKKLTIKEDTFKDEIALDKNFFFKLSNLVENNTWKDIFYNYNNNYENFKFNGSYQKILKSKKLTKYTLSNFILFKENKLFLSDNNGNIIIYGTNNNKIISKYNFYKKKYKRIKKNLNFLIDEDIIYVADNLGYLYSYNHKINNIKWAKNYKIPFRSNIKILKDKIMVSNQNNTLYFFDKKNGKLLKQIPTEETIIKNHFINNLSTDGRNTLFYLNSYGTLYSVNIDLMKINWFVNLNQNLDLNPSNLFFGNEIVNNDYNVIISSNDNTYVIDIKTGSIIYKINFSTTIKPVINNNYVFFVTKNNLLISLNLKSGKILYSYDINKQIAEFLKIKQKNVQFKNLILLNNQIVIFLKNSYVLVFEIDGRIKEVKKLSSKINTQPIFIDNKMLFVNKKNKLVVFD